MSSDPFSIIIDAQITTRGESMVQQKYVLSEQQKFFLLELYDGTTERIEMLARHHLFHGVPRWKMRQWAVELGLARSRDPRWTKEDENYLERNLHRESVQDIADHLGRTDTAVKLKAKRLGVNKCDQEGYTQRGLCAGLGCNHRKIKRWISNGWLKGSRRQTERAVDDTWYFSDFAIYQFIKEHPEEIDPRRADWLWLVDIMAGGVGELGHEFESAPRTNRFLHPPATPSSEEHARMRVEYPEKLRSATRFALMKFVKWPISRHMTVSKGEVIRRMGAVLMSHSGVERFVNGASVPYIVDGGNGYVQCGNYRLSFDQNLSPIMGDYYGS